MRMDSTTIEKCLRHISSLSPQKPSTYCIAADEMDLVSFTHLPVCIVQNTAERNHPPGTTCFPYAPNSVPNLYLKVTFKFKFILFSFHRRALDPLVHPQQKLTRRTCNRGIRFIWRHYIIRRPSPTRKNIYTKLLCTSKLE